MVHRALASSIVLTSCLFFLVAAYAQDMGPDHRLMSLQNDSTSSLADDSTASVSGMVTTADNAPLRDARIEVRDISSGKAFAMGYTGPGGTFQVDHLPRGRYEVLATSGLSEAREQVHVQTLDVSVVLRMPHIESNRGGSATVSVAQMRIPEKAMKALERARNAIAKNRQEEARKQLARAIEIAPAYADAYVVRGFMSFTDGDLQTAGDDFASAIKYDSNNGMGYIAMGAFYNAKGQFDDAIRELERGMSLAPTAWQAYFEISKTQLAKGNFEEALRQVTKAEGLTPKKYSPIYLVKGHALLALKAYPEAISEFEKYLTLEKDSPKSGEIRQEIERAKAFTTTARK